jgi:anaerobic selenocysteine-containing dehydrogenase
VLPVTTFLEHTDLYRAYGHYYVQLARPAIAPPAETRSNTDIFRALAQRMGFHEPCFQDSDNDMVDQALGTSSPFLQGITRERLEQEHFVRLNFPEAGNSAAGAEHEPFLPFANGGFRTPSGKFQFGSESLAYNPPAESRLGDPALLSDFPLEFISAKNDDSMNSTFGNRATVDRQTSICNIHPADAAARGIEDGDTVRVFNWRGECFFTARISHTNKTGLVRAYSVRWNKLSPRGLGVNSVTSERLTDMGGGPTFYSCLVQVEKCTALT